MNLYLLRQMAMSSDINSTFLSIFGHSFSPKVSNASLSLGASKKLTLGAPSSVRHSACGGEIMSASDWLKSGSLRTREQN